MKEWQFARAPELRPTGWLRRQLKIQAEGLSGNLDKIWPDVRDSAWIGGTAEGWERVPYWLDGFVPLAYLLDDEDMKARARRYIDGILARQEEDGWLCPCPREERGQYDTWAVQLISKTLLTYYECSHDERIPSILYKMMKNYRDLLANGTVRLGSVLPFDWSPHRWYEAFPALNFLAERYGEEWIAELAALLRAEGEDIGEHIELWRRPMAAHTMYTHIVNVTMALKAEAVSHRLLGEAYRDRAEHLFTLLTHYHGTAVGAFTGDEHLSGLSPIAGTELCAVVELMYSLEQLFAATGDGKWLDRLERVAFNALPATLTDDMWAHQYDQMSNQIACVGFPRRSLFGTNSGEAHIFGLEPNFGCCTADHGQGWPKLALSSFARSGDTVLHAILLPGIYDSDLCRIEAETDYPFRNTATYRITAKEDFTFAVRIPAGAEHPLLDGAPTPADGIATLRLARGETREVRLTFGRTPRLELRPHDLRTVSYGPLVFSLPIPYRAERLEYTRGGVERKFPYCDYELFPEGEWAFGFSDVALSVTEHPMPEVPFSSVAPALTVEATLRRIPWGYEEGYDTVCARIPHATDGIGEEEVRALYPYGCAKLRMTELPMVK